MLEIELAGESLVLLSQRAIYWKRHRSAIIADPHFGKAAAFRSAGIPIPHGTTGATLDRLRQLLTQTKAERLIVLGDFFHARSGREPRTMAAIESWRADCRQLEIVLVRGNHDRRAGDPPEEWDISYAAKADTSAPFSFAHEPVECPASYVLCGHVHPAVRLPDVCGRSLRSACFWFGARVGVLPAFGSFTGMHCVQPDAGDRVYVIGPEAVIAVPPRAWRRSRSR